MSRPGCVKPWGRRKKQRENNHETGIAIAAFGLAAFAGSTSAQAAGGCALLSGTYAMVQDASVNGAPALSLGKIVLVGGKGLADNLFAGLAAKQGDHYQLDVTCTDLAKTNQVRLSTSHNGTLNPKGSFAGTVTVDVSALGERGWMISDDYGNGVKGSGWMICLPARR